MRTKSLMYFAVLALSLWTACSASGATMSGSVSLASIYQDCLEFPQFDPALGTLNSVRLDMWMYNKMTLQFTEGPAYGAFCWSELKWPGETNCRLYHNLEYQGAQNPYYDGDLDSRNITTVFTGLDVFVGNGMVQAPYAADWGVTTPNFLSGKLVFDASVSYVYDFTPVAQEVPEPVCTSLALVGFGMIAPLRRLRR